MRYVAAYLLAIGLWPFGHAATFNDPPSSLTIVFRFDGPYSQTSFNAMQRELANIMQDSGIEIDWRERAGVKSSDSFSNLVVVSFHGNCMLDGVHMSPPEPGPLAFTYSSNGTVLPFSDVSCDRVRATVRGAMWGDDFKRANFLFGRALARVLAHELYHAVAGTQSHALKGVARRELSGGDLISDQLRLGETELEQMHTGMATSDSAAQR